MKKRFLSAFALLLLVGLSGCKSTSAVTVDVAALGNALHTQVSYDDTLEILDQEIGLVLYGIDAADVKTAAVYASTGGTAEEIAVFEGTDEQAAERIAQAVNKRVADLRASFADYIPTEVARIDNHVLRTQGNYVVLCIAENKEQVEKVINTYLK